MDAAIGNATRGLGAADAQIWRAVEIARALLVLPAPALEAGGGASETSGRTEADAGRAVPAAWLELPAVRQASGWNAWQAQAYVERDAYLGMLDALLARDAILVASGDGDPGALAAVADAVARHRAVAEAAGWRVGTIGDAPDADAATAEAATVSGQASH